MKYLTARILYPNNLYDIPCQSLIPISGSIEYDDRCHCIMISDLDSDICLPISKEQYLGIINQLKICEVVDTSYYCFRYEESTFKQMNLLIYQKNSQKACKWEARN